MNWLDELLDLLEEKVSKVSKFKTHKERKLFLGELRNLVRNTIVANCPKDEKFSNRDKERFITEIVPGKEKGAAVVMTERESARGDAWREANLTTQGDAQKKAYKVINGEKK